MLVSVDANSLFSQLKKNGVFSVECDFDIRANGAIFMESILSKSPAVWYTAINKTHHSVSWNGLQNLVSEWRW